MLNLTHIHLQLGDKLLFQDLTVSFTAKQRVGIVGKNGTGKTSLFRLIQKQLEADDGLIDLPHHAEIATVEQEILVTHQKALDYVLSGDKILQALKQRITDAENYQQWEIVADLYDQFEQVGGYQAEARAAKLLNGLGFSQAEQEKFVHEFSGGWRMRLNLARAIFKPSQILLLDEPTNHLDLPAILWLEEQLKNYQGLLLLISHDVEFLDNVSNSILHIEQQQGKLYGGNYSTFMKERAIQLELQQKTYEKQQKQKSHMEEFIQRFRYKATKAKQAQSRLKMLEKMQLVESVHEADSFRFSFKPAISAGDPLLTFDEVYLGYDDHVVLYDLRFSFRNQDRIALMGANGSGKSTLLKHIAGKLAALSGETIQDPKLAVGFFDQHQMDQLNFSETPLEHLLQLDSKMRESEARNFLGSFAFSNDRVFEKIGNFSGGEKVRLALALLAYQAPNLLLLDEPTNHLDLEVKEALIMALQHYEGAVIASSHDRYFLKAITDELLIIDQQQLKRFAGDVDDYCQLIKI